MTNELTIITHSLFDNVKFDKTADYWGFSFTDKTYASSEGFWRLLKKNKIVFVSLDHEQQFGLPKPINLIEELNRILAGKHLIKIEVLKDTFDLVLTLTEDFKLEIFISSLGYETYNFSINNKSYIGLGSGYISISDIK